MRLLCKIKNQPGVDFAVVTITPETANWILDALTLFEHFLRKHGGRKLLWVVFEEVQITFYNSALTSYTGFAPFISGAEEYAKLPDHFVINVKPPTPPAAVDGEGERVEQPTLPLEEAATMVHQLEGCEAHIVITPEAVSWHAQHASFGRRLVGTSTIPVALIEEAAGATLPATT